MKPIIDQIRLISPNKYNEKKDLYHQIKKGDTAAKSRVVEMHLRKALECSLEAAEEHSLPLDELFSEAVLGLMEFAQHYHYTTYMALGIKKSIEKYIIKNKYVIPLPTNIYHIVEQVKQAKVYCLSKSDMGMAKEISKATGLSENMILQVMPFTLPPLSFEESCEMLYYDGEYYMIERIYKPQLNEILNKALCDLNSKGSVILILRFGMNGNDKQTAKRIAEKYGISGEWVLKIVQNSLLKLKYSKYAESLRNLLYYN